MVTIGRKSAVWLGKETVSGTFVVPAFRVPKKSGWINPAFEEAVDDSGRGVIDEVYDSATVKNMTKVSLWGIVRDDFIGHLFMWALWTHTTVFLTKPTGVTNTPVRWNGCYQWVSFWTATRTWTLKKILTVWANTYYLLKTLTGSFVSGTATKESLTDARTLNAPDSTTYTAVKWHLFERANTNTHPSYTVYDSSSIADAYSPYCMVDTFKITSKIWEYTMFELEMMWKKLVTTTAQSPVYTDQNSFLAKYSNVYFADTEALLNSASAVCMKSFNLNIAKNLADTQCFWSDDIDKLYNQQFTIDWDLEAIYDSVTLRDYVVNSTKKSCRVALINTGATALVTWLYPSIYIDMSKLWFKDWNKTDDLNAITRQTMWFSWQYKATDLMTLEILLLNSSSPAY